MTDDRLLRRLELDATNDLDLHRSHYRKDASDAAAEITRLRSLNGELVKALSKVEGWLERLAAQAEQQAKINKRFPSLSEAIAADAKNYRKIAADLRSVLIRAKEQS